MGGVPSDQGAVSVAAAKAAAALSGIAVTRGVVHQPLKSVVRESRSLRSVGAGGGRLPLATR